MTSNGLKLPAKDISREKSGQKSRQKKFFFLGHDPDSNLRSAKVKQQ